MRQFAHSGYAGTSVQEIVDAAAVTKPALYYYFGNKSGLYQSLVDQAYDERFQLIQTAIQHAATLQDKLLAIVLAMFGFFRSHPDLVRIAFATAFAAPGEIPPTVSYREKSRRNFELVHQLVRDAQEHGDLNPRMDSHHLALSFWGLLNIYIMSGIVQNEPQLDEETARRIVELYLGGAASSHPTHSV